MAALVVRPATRADRAEWLRLRRALWPEGGADHAAEIEELFAASDPSWPQAALLAHAGAAVVGLAEVSVRPIAEGCATRGVGYLEGWFVEPEHRGRGVGRALLRAAEDWARSRGCREMASDSAPENEASRRAHAACGFDEVGLVRTYRKAL